MKLERIALNLDFSTLGAGITRDENGVPTAIRLLNMGVNRSTKGDLTYDQKSADGIAKQAADWGNQYFFDYDHAIFDETNTAPDKGISAGWYDLETRADGLWAINIEWTPKALEYLKNKEFKYFSPAFFFDPKDKRFVQYINTALTNYPAKKNLEPLMLNGLELLEVHTPDDYRTGTQSITLDQLMTMLVQQLEKNFPDMWVVEAYNDMIVFRYSRRYWSVNYILENDTPRITGDAVEVQRIYTPVQGGTTMKVLLNALGLKDDANEAQAIQALSGLKSQTDAVLTLTGKTTLEEAMGVVQAWKAGSAEAAKLTARLAELEAASKAAELETVIAAGKQSGKLTPALEAWARTLPLETVKSYIENAPVVVQLGQQFEPPNNPTGGDAKNLTWNGKTFDQLSPKEQHALYEQNNALYRSMSAATSN